MATRVPTIKSLMFSYPPLTKQTAQLCRDIMYRQLDPLSQPVWFPQTMNASQNPMVETPPRALRMLALAELTGAAADARTANHAPDAGAMAPYGVQGLNLGTRSKPSWVYWLYSPHSPTALTLCSIAPPAPPTRREQQRDPWLYRNLQTIETYRLAVPAKLIKTTRSN